MRLSKLSALIAFAAMFGAIYLFLGDAGGSVGKAESLSELVPDISATSPPPEVRVLSESVATIVPDTDFDGNPVEDHYTPTTLAAPSGGSQAAEEAPEATPTTVPEKDPTATTTPPPPTEEESHFDSGAESSFAGAINNLRSSNGLPALSRSGALDSEARSWAKTLGERGKLSHSNVGRLLPPWSAAAENVATGGDVSSIFSGLAGSGGHVGNMVGDYSHMGIGAWVDATGRIWTVHLFAR